MKKLIKQNRIKSFYKIFLISGIASLLILIPVLFVPANWGVQKTTSINYGISSQNLKSINIIKSNASQDYTKFFAVKTYTFPRGHTINLIPKENIVNEWWSKRDLFIDEDSRIYSPGARYGEYNQREENYLYDLLGDNEAEWIILYDDEEIMEQIQQRVPILKNFETSSINSISDEIQNRPLYKVIPIKDFSLLYFRLAGTILFFILTSEILYQYFLSQQIKLHWVLIILINCGLIFIGQWLLAELNLLFYRIVLTVDLLAAGYIKFYFFPRNILLRKIYKERKKLLVFLGVFFIVFLFLKSKILLTFNGDAWRYIEQARVLFFFNGWNRAYFNEQGLNTTLVAHYPYFSGLLNAGLFWLSGFVKDNLLFPVWNLTVLLYYYNLFIYFLLFISVYFLCRKLLRYSRAYFLIVILYFYLLQDYFLALFKNGAENIFWIFLAALGMFLFYYRKYYQNRIFLLLMSIMLALPFLIKNEYLMIYPIFILPIIYLLKPFSLKRKKRLFDFIIFFIIIPIIPLFAMKIRDFSQGLVSEVYMPLSWLNIRAGSGDYAKILIRQFYYLKLYVVIPLLIVLGFLAFLKLRSKPKKVRLKYLFHFFILCLMIIFYFLVLAFTYMMSAYPSKIEHINQSFARLYVPVILFIILFSPLIYKKLTKKKNAKREVVDHHTGL